MIFWVVYLFLLWVLYKIYRIFVLEKEKLYGLKGRYVLVTGCDSGFGKLLTKRLLEEGTNVFAGCYTLEGEENLKSEGSSLDGQLHTFNLDITSQKSVDSCHEYVKAILDSKDTKLWALVNNAGFCAIYGPNDWITSEEYELSIGVNLMGTIRMTQKFVNLIRRSKGRIVTMISASGRIHGFYTAPYATAKFGLEGYMDSLRLELQPFGVSCHVLEPGGYRTTFVSPKAMDARVESVWSKLSDDIKEEYGEEFKENFKESWKRGIDVVGSYNLNEVVDAYFHALTAKYPRYRYICGWDAKLLLVPLSFLPSSLQHFSRAYMRYGRIYFHDRMGNRVQDDGFTIKDDLLSPKFTRRSMKFRYYSPIMTNGNGITSELPFSLRHDPLDLESPPLGIPSEYNDIDFNKGELAGGESFQYEPGIGPPPILSPLNDLKSYARKEDEERDEILRGLDKLDFEPKTGGKIVNFEENGFGTIVEHPETTDYTIKRDLGHGLEIVERVHEEEGDLCEHCRLEERKLEESRREALLKQKLDEHMREVNLDLKGRRRKEELYPMEVLPPFANRETSEDKNRAWQNKIKYREELEDEIERRRLRAIYDEERDKQIHNFGNTFDAKLFAADRERQKKQQQAEKDYSRDILQKQIEIKKLTKQKDEDRIEWWEKRPMIGVKDERDAAFLEGQLKRNKQLQDSIDQLSRFKAQMEEEDRLARGKQREHFGRIREKIAEQSHLTRYDEEDARLKAQRRAQYDDVVYKAWQEAHMRNDKRYRVLQEMDARRMRAEIERDIRRCRRCHRPIKETVSKSLVSIRD